MTPFPVAALLALLLASSALGQPSEVYGWAWVTVEQPSASAALAVEGGAGGSVYSRESEPSGAAALNLSYILKVHVRLLVSNQVYVPTFNVTYTANGTQRVAVEGEDSIEYVAPAGAGNPVVTLEFPSTVDSYTLVNSTTVTVALTGVDDVWIYYAGVQQPPPPPPGGGGAPPEQPPEQPSQPSQPSQPEQPPQPQQPSLAERIRQWFVWVAEWMAKWLERLWPWWLLLLLALAALLAYLWWRGRRRFVLIIEV